MNPIDEIQAPVTAELIEELVAQARPAVIRQAARDWPLVQAAHDTARLSDYLLSHDAGEPLTVFEGQQAGDERLFYTTDLERHNFRQTKLPLERVLERLQAGESAALYTGSMSLAQYLPGLREENALPVTEHPTTVRIWIGNRTRVAAHYDVMQNLACVCAGRRRFTLFPPEQLPNLYVGPLDFTPAGQAVSLVDPASPDLDRYPRYAQAQAAAQSAELEPGDAIFIPSMWWHQVDALEDFNVLVNHWWREVPVWMGAPGDALLHAILSLRELPAAQRAAWRGAFDHYVFKADEDTAAHIPESRRGVLGELTDELARQLRTILRNRLNR